MTRVVATNLESNSETLPFRDTFAIFGLSFAESRPLSAVTGGMRDLTSDGEILPTKLMGVYQLTSKLAY